jgi:hypothetical protein
MSNAARRVRSAARDASSTDDLVMDEFELWDEAPEPTHPLDEETLDERASTQMGEMWEPRRRDAD